MMNKAEKYLKEKGYHETEYIHGDTVEEFLTDFAEREKDEVFKKGYRLGYRDHKRGNSQKFKDDEQS